MTFQLYPFQVEDVDKLSQVHYALISSEMGTGKTHCAIELDELWNPSGKKPTLVIAPLNTHDSWLEKYSAQSPSTDVVVINRKDREGFVDLVRRKRGDVFIGHWEALRLMPGLQPIEYEVVIGDEVHRISSRKAQVTYAFKDLVAAHKLGLSGTASGDKPDNLWSVANWLYPREFRSYWKHRKRYCTEDVVVRGTATYTQISGVKNIRELHERIAPWYVRHLKREQCCTHHPKGVMPWLKEKTYDKIMVDLNPTQRRIYEQMRKEMVAWVGEHEDSPLVASVIVAQMARLSQIALATPDIAWVKVKRRDPRTGDYVRNDDGTPKLFDQMVVNLHNPSSKITAVKELIKDHGEKQFVLFSASKKACYLAQQDFATARITSEVLSGDTPQSQREGMVKRFTGGDYQVFVGVIEAAGEGIDGLQHATDTAIFLDRSWRTIKNMQAEDRLDRDGQERGVQIIDVIARNTLDLGRLQKLETKWSWIKETLDNPTDAQARFIAEGYGH